MGSRAVQRPEDDLLTAPATRPGRGQAVRSGPGDAAAARGILLGLLACVALTALSVGFVDRPVASFVHALLPMQPGIAREMLEAMTRIPELLGALAILLIVGLGLLRLARGELPALAETAFLAALAMIIADAIKSALKLACGRTWPETWIDNNPSFIRDGVYGFFPFHGGAGWGSLPSGHTTAVSACMAVLWLRLPGGRPAYALAIAATATGLLALDYHFVADILAGFYLGSAVGVATVRIGANRIRVYLR